LVPWILWRIWKNRNDFQYKGRDYDVISTLNKAREDAGIGSDVTRTETTVELAGWVQITKAAEAIQWAAKRLSGFGYRKVIMETDSLVLWPNILPKRQCILHMLRANPEFKVEYCQREGNKVADRIAKKTSSFLNYVPKLYSVTPL
ncbi:unnamed protein product, partial [Brassica rapa]